MNKVHSAVVKYIRDAAAKDGKVLDHLTNLTDEQIVRLMFSNFRGRDQSRGLRLTNFGLEFMQTYFASYEVKMPEGYKIGVNDLLYLDRAATMPYHYTHERLVLFEAELGIKLKLADGNISTLLEMDRW